MLPPEGSCPEVHSVGALDVLVEPVDLLSVLQHHGLHLQAKRNDSGERSQLIGRRGGLTLCMTSHARDARFQAMTSLSY